MKLVQNKVAKVVLTAALLAAGASAQAGWIRVVDPDLTDLAVNPGNTSGDAPTNQNADTIADWIEDLVNAPVDSLVTLEFGNLVDGDAWTLTVPALAEYISVHYGNFGGNDDPLGKATIAYSCASDCAIFTPETVKGISNYRVYNDPGNDKDVPAPAALGLLGVGLLGLGAMRRRARS